MTHGRETIRRTGELLIVPHIDDRPTGLPSVLSFTGRESNARVGFRRYRESDYQENDETGMLVTSGDLPFGIEADSSSDELLPVPEPLDSSETVTPNLQWKQHMEFSDTGIWPCIWLIANERNNVVTHLNALLGVVQHSSSVDACLRHIHEHGSDPHFVVLCSPVITEQIRALVHPRVCKIYVHHFNLNVKDYSALSEPYPSIVSVLRRMDSLVRLLLWDLSACITAIGKYYDAQQNKSLAQARYRYAYRLHLTIREELNNRMQMMEHPALNCNPVS